MKLITITMAFVGSLILLSACSDATNQPKENHQNHISSSPVKTSAKQKNTTKIITQPVVKPYPLKTCIVSDELLDSMDDMVVKVHNGQEIKFCCKACVKKFSNEPQRYLSKIQ